MITKTVKAIYKNGSLKLSRKLPLPNNAAVILTWQTPRDRVEATQGLVRVPRKVVLELTSPHSSSLWDC